METRRNSEPRLSIELGPFKTSVRLIGLALILFGLLIIALAVVIGLDPIWRSLVDYLGGGLLVLGLITVLLELPLFARYFELRLAHVLRRESATPDRVREMLDEALKDIKTEIPRQMVLNPTLVRDLLRGSPHLDTVGTTALQVKLDDDAFGKAVWESLVEWFASFPAREHNHTAQATLSPCMDPELPDEVRELYFLATVDVSYVMEPPYKTEFSFVCVEGYDVFVDKILDIDVEFSWRFPKAPRFPGINASTFSVSHVKVGGISLRERSERSGKGYYEITLSDPRLQSVLKKKSAKVEYRVNVLVSKVGHLLQLFVELPSDGATFELDYSQTSEIKSVSAIEFFVSRERPSVKPTPEADPHKVTVSLDDWVFPKSGVCFVWHLRE